MTQKRAVKEAARAGSRAEEEEEVDVLGEDEAADVGEDVLVSNPAFECVADIRTVLPVVSEDEDEDAHEPIMDRIRNL